MLHRLLVLIALFLVPLAAEARNLGLDSQNRVHVGLSVADGPAFGISGGVDSRMTRILSMDLGGFVSPMALPEDLEVETGAAGADTILLRHGIYVTPGLRLPHRASSGLNWDLAARIGLGGAWTADVHPNNNFAGNSRYLTTMNPALVGGLDFLLRKDAVGLRLSGKGFGFVTFSQSEKDDVAMIRPQWAAEVVYQW